MELAYLSEYITLANEGSFTAAARELRLTQSTLSKHIATLEREFGVELFVRGKGGIRMTGAGALLYEQAKKINALMAQTRAGLRAASNEPASASGAPEALYEAAAKPQGALRARCRVLAQRFALTNQELGALMLYAESRSLAEIERELGISRDEAAKMLGGVYRKMNVRTRQDILDKAYSISE